MPPSPVTFASRCFCGGSLAVGYGPNERTNYGIMPGRRRIACSACGNPIDDVIGLLLAEVAHARPHVDVADELRSILAAAHPDKWPHASELAHEITVRIGALRERIDEREHERSK